MKLYWLTKINGVTKRFPCHVNNIGHITNGDVMTAHPRGYFQTLSYVDGKNVWTTVLNSRCTETSTEHDRTAVKIRAEDALRKQGKITRAKATHKQQEAARQKTDDLHTLASARDAYVAHLEATSKDEAAVHGNLVLKEFCSVCSRAGVTRTQDVRAENITAYMQELEAKGNSERTRANKHDRVFFFLKWVNTKTREDQESARIPFKGDRVNLPTLRKLSPRPEYDKNKKVKTYSREQVERLFEAAGEGTYMETVLLLGLYVGLREQEIMHAEWADLNWKARKIHVENKEHLDFSTKTKQHRDVPLGATIEKLRTWREKNPTARLIVGTAHDRPNTHLLRTLKRMAKNAGLNCGQCKGCLSPAQECRDFGLHTLRRTYCTSLFRGKHLDDKSIMEFMGHKELKTTLRYRDALNAESKRAQDAVSNLDFGD